MRFDLLKTVVVVTGLALFPSNALSADDTKGAAEADVKPISESSGQRYLRARRPELYGKLVEPPSEPPVTTPGWKRTKPADS